MEKITILRMRKINDTKTCLEFPDYKIRLILTQKKDKEIVSIKKPNKLLLLTIKIKKSVDLEIHLSTAMPLIEAVQHENSLNKVSERLKVMLNSLVWHKVDWLLPPLWKKYLIYC